MIVRPRPSAFGLLFILRGSILPMIALRVLLVLALSAGIAWVHHVAPRYFQNFSPAPFTLLGLALSIFLGFRNNACYERWWEGRKQWGQLIAEARGLARDGATLLPPDTALQQRFARRIIAFAHALRRQLRGTHTDGYATWLDKAEAEQVAKRASHPDAILCAQADELGSLHRQGALSDILYQMFSARLQAMTNIQTACERLKSTPTPFAYTLLLHRTAWLFCLLLPFGLVSSLGMATPVVTTILAYAFFGLDALGEELEEPFGLLQNALPLDALVRAIEIAVLESLGEPNLPAALQPQGFILR